MKNAPLRILGVAFALLLPLARAATNPPADDAPPPLTAQEIHQGFRDRVILARPREAARASAPAAEAREGVRVRETFPRFRDLRIIELDAGDSSARAIARLQATGRYEFVEPDYLRSLAVEPNDPQFANGNLWALKNTGQAAGIAGADIKATQAWDIIHDAPNVIVAVVDTGVNLSHQDIAANLWRNPSPTFGDVNGARFLNGQQSGNPTDDGGHGTHVAGTIGAIGNNNLATTGIAWKVQIMAVKVFPGTGTGSVSDIARGVNYAVAHGAHIINASYGALNNSGFSQTELAAITAARDAGVIFVAAAGNSAANMDVSRFYPASHALDNIVTVGNSTRRDELSLSSNYGAAVDLFAPGSEIISLNYANNTGTANLSGTSMAAPHVAGALALLKARFPGDTYRQLINRLLRGVDPGERFAGKAATGGRLNLLKALQTESDPNGNRPFNDTFARRPRYNSDNLAIRASNTGATAEAGEPAHGGNAPSATLWWEWVAPATGTVSIDTSGSTYDTVLALYTGNALGALTPVASNDNDAGKITSRVSFTAQAGTTYQIAVDGKNGASGLTLLNLGSTPANDAFAAPVVLGGESARVTATNARCTLEAGEPRIGTFSGGTSLWYRWTAPRSGRFQVAAASTDFDPILAVYTGSTLAALTLADATLNAAANDKANGATWTLNATAGTTYAITVDTKDARAVGVFTLSLTDSLWQYQVGGAITGAPAVARDGSIYFGSTDRALYALNPDGTPKWSFTTGGLIDTCSPAVAEDGTVYVGSNDGNLYAFNPDGTQKWTHGFNQGATINAASNSPALGADGTIYVKAGDGFLYALAPADGAVKWRYNVNGPTSYGSPSVALDGTIYVGSDDKSLYALNPDGSRKWVFTHPECSDIYTVPAIDASGNIYFTVLNTGYLFSVSAGGTLRWIYRDTALGSSSSPCLSPDGGTVYFGGYDKKLHAVNTATGAARWVYPLGDEVRASSPAVDAGGVVYLGAYDFKLYAINPDGTLKRTYDTGNWIRSCPALVGTTLYVGSNDQKLYAFPLAAGAGSGPWAQYRHNAHRTGRPVVDALAIVTPPASQVAVLGLDFSLTVAATGQGAISYQWAKDGSAIPGATNATYTVPNVTAATAGRYTVTVSSVQGSITSEPAVVTVEPVTPGRLVNLSVRTNAGRGADGLVIGFVVKNASAGAAAKPLLIRGIGPTLESAFGLAGTLADPQLQVIAPPATVVASNDDWGGGATLASAFTSVGAFALERTSRDAALVTSLAPAAYTAQVSGAGNTTGLALAEVYDLEPTNVQTLATVARLGNLSARAPVGTGGDILIAGFTISGNVPKQVLIRGIGPALALFGLGGFVADPKLEIYRGSTKVNENDNWGGTAALSAAFDQAGAFRLTSAASRDAALLLTLAPGSYTAQLSGVGGGTGVGLIEVYEVP